MKRFVTLICVAVLCGTIAAQQNSSPDATKQGSDGQKNGGTEPSPALSGTDFDQYDVSSLPQAEQFHVLGGARLLQSGPGGIRLGPVRLGEVSLSGGENWFRYPGEPQSTQWFTMANANLVFDKRFQSSRIAIQYQPGLVVVDGEVQGQYANQHSGLDTFFKLTPRLTLNLSDYFDYMSNQSQFLQPSVQANPATGYVTSSDFLLRQGNWLSNAAQAPFAYKLNALTTITFTPSATFSYSTDTPLGNRGLMATGSVAVSRQFSPRQTLGAYYTIQHTQFASLLSDDFYHNFGLSYARQLPGRFYASLQGGAVLVAQSSGNFWTGTASASLTKDLRWAVLGITYVRASSFTTVLTNGISDQVGVSYTQHLTRTLDGSLQAGYYDNSSNGSNNNESKYGSVGVQYRLSSGLKWSISYTQQRQSGTGPGIFVGRRDGLSTGLFWIPGTPSRS